ncbi:MAG: tRNA pseudouridine(38-40) synthase TruA [Leptospirales bacterium]
MRRFAFTVSYDGRRFQGWQQQRSGATIQGTIEDSFRQLTGQSVRIQGSGRTDTGVSAWGQVFHVDIAGERWTPESLRKGLNHFLPFSIRILEGRDVLPDFHARHDVIRKIYRYRFSVSPGGGYTPAPLGSPFHSHFHYLLDFSLMKRASASFLGIRDYRHFTVRRSLPEDSRRTIDDVYWETDPSGIWFWVVGRGFLHMMIRFMVGALIDVGRTIRTPEEIDSLLTSGTPAPRFPLRPAYPEGLALIRVLYGKKDPFSPFSGERPVSRIEPASANHDQSASL